MHDVTLWLADHEDPVEVDGVEFVSLVNNQTYGIPPVFKDQPTLTGRVLYINTTSPALCAFEINRKSA